MMRAGRLLLLAEPMTGRLSTWDLVQHVRQDGWLLDVLFCGCLELEMRMRNESRIGWVNLTEETDNLTDGFE